MEPFAIRVDPARHMLRATLCGFWDEATAQRFTAELERGAAAIRRPSKPSYWLIDIKEGNPQSQATMTVMQDTVVRLSKEGFSYVAVVTFGAIVAMQVRRIKTEGHEMFTDLSAAEAWLAERRAANEVS